MTLHDLHPDDVRMITILEQPALKILLAGNRELIFHFATREEMSHALESWARAKSPRRGVELLHAPIEVPAVPRSDI